MTTVGDYYGTIDTAFAFGNDDTNGVTEYAQFNTLVTNKFFTPDNDTDPEDLQFRVSKDVKFFLGSNDTSTNSEYSLKLSDDSDNNVVTFQSARQTMNFSADYVAMGGIAINETAAATRLSSEKLMQIHSGVKFQMLGQSEFKNEAKFDKNVYIGQSLIFQQSNYGGDSNDQVRIAFQYNQNRDTLDIVKQKGNGAQAGKRLMARLGLGGVMGNTAELDNVPYYQSTPVSGSYSADAPVYEDVFDSWIDAHASNINVSVFQNNVGYLTTINQTPIESKWRFKESPDGEELYVEKFDGTNWVLKFKFED